MNVKGGLMKIEEISKELEQYEHKMQSLMLQMDNLYGEIKVAMPAATASWMNKEVVRRIRDNPEIVQSIGIEKLGELKSKLKTLTEKLPEIVEAEFHDRGKWPHHVEWVEIPSSQREEPHLNRIFRNVISNIGSLLSEFSLIKGPKGHLPSWGRTGDNRFRYTINPGLDNLPKSKIEDYWNLFNEYTALSSKIKDSRKVLAEAKAKELWDKA